MATAPTVPNPAPISPPVGSPQSQAPTTISRDYNREAETLKKLGTNPLQAATLDPKALYEMTYSPDELANLPEYQNVLAVQDAKQSLINTPAPSATLLRPLEDALRIKGNIGKQKLGESDIFKSAGLSGYATLNQSINQNLQDMDTKYNSFVNQVSKIGGAMADTYNTVASKYKVLMDEYKTQTESIQAVMRDLMNHEQAIDLMNRQQALDLEAKAFAASLSGRGGGGSGSGGGGAGLDDNFLQVIVDEYAAGEISEAEAKARIKAESGLSKEKDLNPYYAKFYQMIRTPQAKLPNLPLPSYAENIVKESSSKMKEFKSPKQQNKENKKGSGDEEEDLYPNT